MDFLRKVGIFSVRQKAIVTLWVTCVYLQITYHFIASQFSTLCPNSSWLADYWIIAVVIMGRMAEPDRSCDGVTFNVTDGLLNHPAALLLFIYLFIARIHRALNLKQISLTTAAPCVTWHHLTGSLGRPRRRVWAISVNPHVRHVHADVTVRARVSNTQAEQKGQRPARSAP